MIGPRCDYRDCPRHAEQVERMSLTRRHYCSIDCRNDEIKRRLREHEAKKATV
jgi:hypothetical protein